MCFCYFVFLNLLIKFLLILLLKFFNILVIFLNLEDEYLGILILRVIIKLFLWLFLFYILLFLILILVLLLYECFIFIVFNLFGVGIIILFFLIIFKNEIGKLFKCKLRFFLI